MVQRERVDWRARKVLMVLRGKLVFLDHREKMEIQGKSGLKVFLESQGLRDLQVIREFLESRDHLDHLAPLDFWVK